MFKILVFDTETTGLPNTGSTWAQREETQKKLFIKSDNGLFPMWDNVLESWPHILQLSYILYDTDTHKSTNYNKYIELDDDVEIDPESYAIHKISKEDVRKLPQKQKTRINKAIMYFIRAVKKSDIVVGHNVTFDRLMIISEMLNNPNSYVEDIHEMMNENKFACTMEIMKPVCNICKVVEYKDKKTNEQKSFTTIKTPSLLESYKHLFGYSPTDLHNSLYDSVVCLRVYCKQLYNIDVYDTNHSIKQLIIMITPSDNTK